MIRYKYKIPRADALHLVIAKENKAIMITRDKHFFEFSDYVKIKRPEDLI